MWVWRGASLAAVLAGIPALLKSAILYALCSLAVYFHFSGQLLVKVTPEREFKNWGGRFLPLYFLVLPPAWMYLAVEQNGWTEKVWIGGLLFIALLGPCVYLRLVAIPRAIADRKLYRLRSLLYASNVFLMPSLGFPMRMVSDRPLPDGPGETVFLAAFCGIVVWMAAMALVNWRKREEVYHEPEGVVSRS